MARYNRDFLVPYLHDICSLHLLVNKLNDRLSSKKYNIWQIGHEAEPHKPPYPTLEEASVMDHLAKFIGILGCALCVLLEVLFLFTVKKDFFIILLMVVFGFAGLMLWGITIDPSDRIKSVNERNESAIRIYEYDCSTLKQNQEAWQKRQNRLPELTAEVQEFEAELHKVENLLRLSYSANVIPKHYRNMYVAVYLYDWFSTCRADDLDAALNMFVLEEIKAKLDEIIELQTEMILNQRLMIANQQRSIEQQDEHNRLMRNKVDNLQASLEEQNQYYNMIESNTAATAYFAAAQYINSL